MVADQPVCTTVVYQKIEDKGLCYINDTHVVNTLSNASNYNTTQHTVVVYTHVVIPL